MNNKILNNISRTAHRVGFKVKKHSPEILIAAGIVGVITSTVLACKATTKLDDILDESKNKLDKLHEAHENPEEVLPADVEYTEQDYKSDLVKVYFQSGVQIAKLYAPSAALMGLSIFGIIKSHNILSKRNAAIAAAYAAIDKGFKEYRGRVIERLGADMDKELRYNIKTQQFEETTVNEKGKEKTVKNNVDIVDDLGEISEYARFFDSSCRAWEDNSEYNLSFLLGQQKYLNHVLKTRGHVFLNEVYDALGFDRTSAGAVVGWIYNAEAENEDGDEYIDFGIHQTNRPSNRRFVNGYEPVILLDFNVDGIIYDKI